MLRSQSGIELAGAVRGGAGDKNKEDCRASLAMTTYTCLRDDGHGRPNPECAMDGIAFWVVARRSSLAC
ncbi:MAG: hypothetical protein K0Q77_1792 [Anaerosporomusa subterranea]|nr:hypothetical protein [Anaerosporomusa subterranea]